ncbi:hypothetical protein ADUPG1_012057, partial [Aduncisulcus paluster]
MTNITNILPLIFIISIAAIREIIEDLARVKQDKYTNSMTFQVIREGKCSLRASSDIEVGDIVHVPPSTIVPADIVPISGENGQAYIETANLDGETSLKRKIVPPPIARHISSEATRISTLSPIQKDDLGIETDNPDEITLENVIRAGCTFSVQVEPPNPNFHTLRGSCSVKSNQEPSRFSYLWHERKKEQDNSFWHRISQKFHICCNSHEQIREEEYFRAEFEQWYGLNERGHSSVHESVEMQPVTTIYRTKSDSTKSTSPESDAITDTLPPVSSQQAQTPQDSLTRPSDLPPTTHPSRTVHPITGDSFIPRGASIQHTSNVWGLVVYTGEDTRLMQNAGESRNKPPGLFSYLNWSLITIIIIQVILVIALTFGAVLTRRELQHHWYLGHSSDPEQNLLLFILISVGTNFLVTSFVVPISLFVSLEVVRYV